MYANEFSQLKKKKKTEPRGIRAHHSFAEYLNQKHVRLLCTLFFLIT